MHQQPTAQDNLPPRRSTRDRKAPDRLGYDGRQGRGYVAEGPTNLLWLINALGEQEIHTAPDYTLAYKTSSSDPDTLSFDEAMSDTDNIKEWMKAANAEIESLVKNGTWKEVSVAEAKTRILPGTWVF